MPIKSTTASKMNFPPKPNLQAMSLTRGSVAQRHTDKHNRKMTTGGLKRAVSGSAKVKSQARSSIRIDAKEGDMNKNRKKGVDEVVEELIRDANPASMFELHDCEKDPHHKGPCNSVGPGTDKDRNGTGQKKKKKFPFYQAFSAPETNDRHRIEYHVEHPIRVAIRLEYLMGTATVYLNDMAYINKLHRAIRKEEERIHKEITAKREGIEKTRVKKLVLEGKMAPPPGMEDLLDHPVFKVNKMLETMEGLETAVREYKPRLDDKIVSVEPFQDDNTGEYFKTLHQGEDAWSILLQDQSPRHTIRRVPKFSYSAATVRNGPRRTIINGNLSRRGSRRSSSADIDALIFAELRPGSEDMEVDETEVLPVQSLTWAQLQEVRHQEEEKKKKEDEKDRLKDLNTLYPSLVGSEADVPWDKADEEEEEEEALYDTSDWNKVVGRGRLADEEIQTGSNENLVSEDAGVSDESQGPNICREDTKTLKQLKKMYKLKDKIKLCKYTPYESDLLTQYIDEATDVKSMFDNAEEVKRAYEREIMVSDDFVKELTRKMNA